MDLPDELARLGPSKDVGERLRVTFHGPPKHVNPPVATKPLRTVPGRASHYEKGCDRGVLDAVANLQRRFGLRPGLSWPLGSRSL